MSNRDVERTYQNLADVLEFCFQREIRNVHTTMPGKIVSYENGLAAIEPGLRVLMTDGSVRDRPVLSNVPVLHPAGGGYRVHVPLRAGDPVILLFAMRGIEEWKRTRDVSNPGAGVMALDAAMAIPAGSAGGTARDGLVIEGNGAYIQIDGSEITLSGNVNVDGALTVGGVPVSLEGSHPRIKANSNGESANQLHFRGEKS